MKNIIRLVILPIAMLFAASAQSALITFNFIDTDERGLLSYTDTQQGLTLTVDNPKGNDIFDENSFGFILGGLFLDGGFAPSVDFTFSQDVSLVSFTLANDDIGTTFDLTQGTVQSLSQSLDVLGTFSFNNTNSVFNANQAITLLHSNHDGAGFSFSSFTVETVSPVSNAPLLSLVTLAALAVFWRRKFTV
ncbi:hypothetical protein PN836_005265 [Ningiella sp. W23]|uniref:hypothetical protein n=1 Tax=Ningiella sp. W23 TaxID=3023715 RepID=UPI003758102B